MSTLTFVSEVVLLRESTIELLSNKFHGLSPSGGFASLSFDQGVPKKLQNTAPSSRSELHLMVFCINQIVLGFVVYYLNTRIGSA